jgi:hypothetical protein
MSSLPTGGADLGYTNDGWSMFTFDPLLTFVIFKGRW